MRWFRRTIAAVGSILAFAGVGVAVAQAPAGGYPPTGKLVDAGGYRVHLNCAGSGQPTVLIVGAGFSFDWTLVQEPASTVTRVCTYDPSGGVWSDPGPATPTCAGRVLEIHNMLHTAGIDGPIVLVGHSMGAVFARMYAQKYPGDVKGMVISDHAGAYRLGPATAGPFGTLTTTIPTEEDSEKKLPLRAQALHQWATSSRHSSPVQFYNRCIGELESSPANKPRALGNTPLVLVANQTLAVSEDYVKKQSVLLATSTDGATMLAATYGHNTPMDDPGVLIRAIKHVVEAARK